MSTSGEILVIIGPGGLAKAIDEQLPASISKRVASRTVALTPLLQAAGVSADEISAVMARKPAAADDTAGTALRYWRVTSIDAPAAAGTAPAAKGSANSAENLPVSPAGSIATTPAEGSSTATSAAASALATNGETAATTGTTEATAANPTTGTGAVPAQASTEAPAANQVPFVNAAGHKAIVVVFSQHGNTEAAAWLIQKLIDIDVVQLKPVQLYPRDYKGAFEQVKIENELEYLPKFNALETDLSGFDHVFVGFPNWDDQLPPPVKSWLSRTDWQGKTILPFCTHAGAGAGKAFTQLAALCPNAQVTPGLALEGGATRDNCALAIRGRRMAQAEKDIGAWLAEVRR
ncbi:MAG: flavodoxin [Lautropia sp.]|nr:flavodoxin [Lautropia sp.]